MQRLIKFRVWNTVAKAMYPLEHFGLGMKGDTLQLMPECEHYDKPFVVNNAGALVYMQYTGLKDKNGVEIYEGDIILVIDAVSMEQSIHDVKWVGVGWTRQILFTQVEVIGNIYENPHLLEATK